MVDILSLTLIQADLATEEVAVAHAAATEAGVEAFREVDAAVIGAGEVEVEEAEAELAQKVDREL